MTTALEVYNYYESRWTYYEQQDGAYYPSKHDSKVFIDAAEHFSIASSDAEKLWDEISKKKANEMVKGMSQAQMSSMFNNILKNNAETPWGQAKLKK